MVAAFGLFLVGLAVVIATRPLLAERFLSLFASSAAAHYTEQGSRLLVGLAMVTVAPRMRVPDLFRILGWLLIITAAGLLLVPWRWHHKFGAWAIPLAIRHLKLVAAGAFAMGGLVLFSLSRLFS